MYLKNLDEHTSVYELDSMQSVHLAKVLRMKEGQEVELFNGSGLSCKAAIVEISKKFTKVQATSSFVSEDIPTKTITAIVPFLKKDNLFYMAQKLTEMGLLK
jgi:16S rRNA (uracil1498-N3)-methyltransferase